LIPGAARGTPTLEKPVWTYWLNRFVRKELRFGADGRTVNGL
jgi:hypothetical protein